MPKRWKGEAYLPNKVERLQFVTTSDGIPFNRYWDLSVRELCEYFFNQFSCVLDFVCLFCQSRVLWKIMIQVQCAVSVNKNCL